MEDYVNNPYYLKEWSQKEIEDMIAKAVKPLQEQIGVLEREQNKLYDDLLARIENIAKHQVDDWNKIQEQFHAWRN